MLQELQEELQGRQTQQASLQALWSLLRPRDTAEDRGDAQETLHVTRNKLKQLRRRVEQDHHLLQQRLVTVRAWTLSRFNQVSEIILVFIQDRESEPAEGSLTEPSNQR